MSIDALPDEATISLLIMLAHVSTVLVCWIFYRRMKRRNPELRLSYQITNILALTLSMAVMMGLVLRAELSTLDQVGFLVTFLPSQIAGAFCAQAWVLARTAARPAGVSSFMDTFCGALLGLVVFPILGVPAFFATAFVIFVAYVTFPFGLFLSASVWLAYSLRTRVPLLPRTPPSVEASHANPKSPQDPTPPPKN
jgi:hypothetical protein